MTILTKILKHNKEFVIENNEVVGQNNTCCISKVPSSELVILTCMDTRLVEFLEQATGIRRGQAKIIKNAGNIIAGSFGETIRSLVISIFELGVSEIIVIGHHDCGMSSTESGSLINKMLTRGISQEALDSVNDEIEEWVDAYHDPEGNVLKVVQQIKDSPFIPNDILVHGLLFCPNEGRLEIIFHDKRNLINS